MLLASELNNKLLKMLPADIKAASSDDDSSYQPHESESIYLSKIKNPQRSKYFRLGRISARKALCLIDPKYHNIPLARLDSGDIDWPAGTIGSVSHSRQIAVAVAAEKNNYSNLGIDFEAYRNVNLKLIDKICTRQEQDIISPLISDRNTACLILFSCKEAIYKAINKNSDKPLGFQDACLIKIEQTVNDCLNLRFKINSDISAIDVLTICNSDYCLSVCYSSAGVYGA